MPAWWSKRYGRNKNSVSFDGRNKGRESDEGKARSFEEVLLQPPSGISPRKSTESSPIGRGLGSRNLSGFDSSSSLDLPLPLPRPSEPPNDHVHAPGSGSGFASVSSVSSSGSCDDHGHGGADHPVSRGNAETNSSVILNPDPGSRCSSSASSPLSVRLRAINLESPTGKPEEGKSELHKLPLPPGSPTSPANIHPSKWRKGKLLGKGTYGHVYLAFNNENGQMCAIKEVEVISNDRSSKESLRQLNQEISLLRRFSHPNIVRYYGSDLSEETLSVYLEYVSGGSIHKLLQEYGAFGERVIQKYTQQILSGVAYLHSCNTVHRDIKGANILVDPNGEIKLADFGMAKHIASASSMLSFKGSPYWMAPEVVLNKNGYSSAVDIWSLGCTILEMATSRPPWSQFEGVAAIFKIGNSKDLPDIPDRLSADAKDFIKLCLQRDPSKRPSASQLLCHRFFADQSVGRGNTAPVSRDTSPHPFDESFTPPILEMHSNRRRSSFQPEDASILPMPRTLISPRDNARTITSLPVSPSSSPLRSNGAQHRDFFLTPSHPAYTTLGNSDRFYGNVNISPLRRPNLFDPRVESLQFRPRELIISPTKTPR